MSLNGSGAAAAAGGAAVGGAAWAWGAKEAWSALPPAAGPDEEEEDGDGLANGLAL